VRISSCKRLEARHEIKTCLPINDTIREVVLIIDGFLSGGAPRLSHIHLDLDVE